MFRIFLKIPTPVNLEELKNLHLSSWFSEVESKIWSLRIRKYSENGPGNGALLPTSEWKTDAQFGAKLTRLVKTESPQREISSQWTSLGNKINSRNINFVVISLGTHVVDRVGKCPPSWISLSIQTQHLETCGFDQQTTLQSLNLYFGIGIRMKLSCGLGRGGCVVT